MEKSYTEYLLDRDCVLLDGSCKCEKPIRDCKYLTYAEDDEEQDI